jgi:hypothetical protein
LARQPAVGDRWRGEGNLETGGCVHAADLAVQRIIIAIGHVHIVDQPVALDPRGDGRHVAHRQNAGIGTVAESHANDETGRHRIAHRAEHAQ